MIIDVGAVELEQFQFPITVVWEITNRCKSNCIYCSGGFPDKQSESELLFEEKKQLVRELINQKLFAINISGGEPFLSDDLLWVVDELTNAGIQVMIVTSGLIHDEEKIKALVENPFVGFNISLDSFDSEVNDLHRGVINSVDRVCKFIDEVSADHKYIALESVLTRKNINNIEQYVENVKRYNISEVRFQPAVAVSKKAVDSKICLEEEEIFFAEEMIADLAKKVTHTRVRFVNQKNTVIAGYKNKRNWGGIISPNGELRVNAYLPYTFGNIRSYGSLKNAWDKGFGRAWGYPLIQKELSEINSISDITNLHKKYNYNVVNFEL